MLAVAPAGERRAAVDRGRAGRLPAVRAREARARDLGRELPLEPAGRRGRSSELAKPFGLLGCLFAGLIVLEPDLGTAIAIVLMLFAMLLVAGTSARAARPRVRDRRARPASIAIYLEPYRRARFFAFLHPWDDAKASGFQIVQAMIGMGSGGIFGVGLGQGVQKIFDPPEAPTDMMLANIGEGARAHLGVSGCARGPTWLFAYAGFRIALHCRDPFGKRLAAGLTVLVCGQAAVNVWAVVGSRR